MSYRIRNESSEFNAKQIADIEAHYEARYVCETCLRLANNAWGNFPVAIFYQADESKVPEGGSQYFGLFWKCDQPLADKPKYELRITNAIGVLDQDITGIVAENGDVIYSRYRHDFRGSDDKSVYIDGGRDYTRSGWNPDYSPRYVKLKVMDGELKIIEDIEESNL